MKSFSFWLFDTLLFHRVSKLYSYTKNTDSSVFNKEHFKQSLTFVTKSRISMTAWISSFLVQNMTCTVPWDCNRLAYPELQKTARGEAKGISFPSCPSKGNRRPLLAARHLQRPSYKVNASQGWTKFINTGRDFKRKKKKTTTTPLRSINCETEVKNIMNSSEVISQAAE